MFQREKPRPRKSGAGAVDQKERRQAAATAASFKFDMIDALMVDHRLSPKTFKIAVALLQFQNSVTGDLYPSQATISETTGIPERTVRECLSALRDTGWLLWDRGNRQRSNAYSFDHANIARMQAKRKRMELDRKLRKAEARKAISDRQPTAAQDFLTGSPPPVASGSPPPPNYLKGTPYRKAATDAA